MSERFRAFHALPANEKGRYIGNWLLDRAMIIIILLLVIYIQSQRPAFLQPASIINILSLTASRLPIALGIAGRIIGLTGFLSAIMLQKAGTANRFIEAMGPLPIPVVILAVMALGALIGLDNGFCVAKFKLHPFIVTLSTQLITYGALTWHCPTPGRSARWTPATPQTLSPKACLRWAPPRWPTMCCSRSS